MRTSIFLTFPAIILVLVFGCIGPQHEKGYLISLTIDGYENDTIFFWQHEALTYSKEIIRILNELIFEKANES